MQKILIFGATSAIAERVARIYAKRAAQLHLVGRNAEKLQAIASDLIVRGASSCSISVFDLSDPLLHAAALAEAEAALGRFDVVLIAHGTLPDQAACDASTELAMREFANNGSSVIALCNRIVPMLSSGNTLAVISSVAGDRGRASNYLYGAAKSAVTAYLSGLGQRLAKSGINVLVIKPGFVDTPMTAAFKKGPLWATPDAVADGITRAIGKRRAVVYLPWFWWGIMQIIKAIPESIFRRIKL